MSETATDPDQSWFITQRWQQYEGEARANLLRILAIGTFYLIHLWNYFSSQATLPDIGFLQLAEEGAIDRRFHLMVTCLAISWVMMASAVHFSLRSRFFPTWLSMVSTLCDVLFLTSLLLISSGPQSPLVVGYFLIIALAALRFDLRLVQLATIATVVGYLCLLGYAKWPVAFGRDASTDYKVPRYQQLIVLAALVLTGIIIGQVVRRVRGLAADYATRAVGNGAKAT